MKPYRPPTRSRAAPDTLCQKCLKRGHYSYECTAKAQERPYTARASRTQQLSNPKLVPQLTNDVPSDLLRKKGVADEQLAKKELDRPRKRSLERENHARPFKRSRSVSSRSSSVSTMSTNRSPSPPPKRAHQRRRHNSPSPVRNGHGQNGHGSSRSKRRRSHSSSTDSQDSRVSDGMREARAHDRNTRRRLSSFSPSPRGRRRRRESIDDAMDRTLSRSASPPRRRRPRSRSLSRRGSRSRITSHRPSPPRGNHIRDAPIAVERGPSPPARDAYAAQVPPPQPPRERSLSPFSKRLALTRAMNQGAPVANGNGAPPPWR